jgi:hypothetical protein
MWARACVYIILYFMYILSCTASPVHPVWFLRPVRRAHRARWCCGVRDSNSWYTKITQDGNLDFFSHSRIAMIYTAGRYVRGPGTTTLQRQLLHNVWRKRENYPCEIAMIKTKPYIIYIRHPARSYITANGNAADVLIMHANNIRGNLHVSLWTVKRHPFDLCFI